MKLAAVLAAALAFVLGVALGVQYRRLDDWSPRAYRDDLVRTSVG